MKVGDLVKMSDGHSGIIIRRWGECSDTHGRAWYILTDGGIVRPKLSKDLRVVNG